jgi:hypothetical protein
LGFDAGEEEKELFIMPPVLRLIVLVALYRDN